jgi:hypothetical protein
MSCKEYRPDHNGECLNCDEYADAHRCNCIVKDREENESEREWFKRWMCMFHWMQTDYYRSKLNGNDRQ